MCQVRRKAEGNQSCFAELVERDIPTVNAKSPVPSRRREAGPIFLEITSTSHSLENSERARAVTVGLLDIEQQALQHFRFFIRVENFKAGAVQISSVDNLDSAIDPDRIVVLLE